MKKLKVDRKLSQRPLVLSVGPGLDSLVGSMVFLENILRYKHRPKKIVVLYNDFEVFFPFIRNAGQYVANTVKNFAEERGFDTEKVVTEGTGFLDRIVFEGERPPTLNFRWCLFFYRYKPTLKVLERTGGFLCLFWRHDEPHVRRSRIKTEQNWVFPTVYKQKPVYLPIFQLSRNGVLKAIEAYSSTYDFSPVLKIYDMFNVPLDKGVDVRCWACTARKTDSFEKLISKDRKLFPYVHANREIKEWLLDLNKNIRGKLDEKKRLELAYILFRHGIWSEGKLKETLKVIK